MDTPNATRANAALWSHYFEQQFGAALAPAGGVFASGLIGIAVANAYAAAWGEFIGSLFEANASEVSAFVRQTRASRLVRPSTDLTPDVPSPWLRVSAEEIVPAEGDRELDLLALPI